MIKIAFSGIRPENSIVYKIMKKNYNVEISSNPDYIICGCFDGYSYCKYEKIRIFECGENYIPDFNLIDYAVCSYPIRLLDRNIYIPQSISEYLLDRKDLEKREEINTDILHSKTRFANFIAGHESENRIRGDFFHYLEKNYRHVDSVGRYLNNQPNGRVVNRKLDKIDFQKTCKFTLCFESTSSGGFNTEKITDAFYASTIPIYFGDPYIESIFNGNAFINVHKYGDWTAVLDKIRYLDTNDDAYMKVLNEPVFVSDSYLSDKSKELEIFLNNIIEQPYDEAYRRSRCYWAKGFETHVKNMEKVWNSKPLLLSRKCLSFIKK